MNDLYIFGGVNATRLEKGKAWSAYRSGRIVKLNLISGEKELVAEDSRIPEWITPDCPVGTVFKTSGVFGNTALVCTTTEIFEYSFPEFKLLRSVSMPKLNDVHHVIPANNGSNVIVAVTGIDGVIELDWRGGIVNQWPLDERSRKMLSDDVDYRKVASTKPHTAHPNHVFYVGDRLYVTRFASKDAICLNDESAPDFHGLPGNPHDGLIKDDLCWFSTVNGYLHAASIKDGAVERQINLNGIGRADRALGWCRGICFVDEDLVAIGFSRLRQTKFKENLKWLASKYTGRRPPSDSTRVVLYDVRKDQKVAEYNLESDPELNAVFSISMNLQ